MTSGKIFLIDDGAKNVRQLAEAPYETEDILQRLLVLQPDLLPGDQINPEKPRDWLLVKRELGVPDEEGGTDRWSLDHLFLDQDGMPTFVECKRSSDSRARREVVAQMLDYAANGLRYWSVDNLRQAATETAQSAGENLNERIRRLFGLTSDEDIEAYWKTVEKNFQDQKARLIFVADKISSELKRLIEFLNEKMTDVEVLAVEVLQYRGEGLRAVVPRVVGLTEKSREIKTGAGVARKATITLEQFRKGCTIEAADFFEEMLKNAEQQKFSVYYGTVGISIRANVATADREYASFVYCWPPNTFEVYLAQLPLAQEDSRALRKQLLDLNVFREAGEWTLRATVEEGTLAKLQEAYRVIFEKAHQLVRT